MLTRKQRELLKFIQEKLGETGISPSFDEMKEALGLKSKSGWSMAQDQRFWRIGPG